MFQSFSLRFFFDVDNECFYLHRAQTFTITEKKVISRRFFTIFSFSYCVAGRRSGFKMQTREFGIEIVHSTALNILPV